MGATSALKYSSFKINSHYYYPSRSDWSHEIYHSGQRGWAISSRFIQIHPDYSFSYLHWPPWPPTADRCQYSSSQGSWRCSRACKASWPQSLWWWVPSWADCWDPSSWWRPPPQTPYTWPYKPYPKPWWQGTHKVILAHIHTKKKKNLLVNLIRPFNLFTFLFNTYRSHLSHITSVF